jgi:hypothetical protein
MISHAQRRRSRTCSGPAARCRRRPHSRPPSHDRGPKGTHHGAIIPDGNLYCPARPRACSSSCRPPAAPRATLPQAVAHDAKSGEAARHKPGRLTRDDAGGHRVHQKVDCMRGAASRGGCGYRPRRSAVARRDGSSCVPGVPCYPGRDHVVTARGSWPVCNEVSGRTAVSQDRIRLPRNSVACSVCHALAAAIRR